MNGSVTPTRAWDGLVTRTRVCDGDFGRRPYCVEVEVPTPNATHNTRGALHEIWRRTWRKADYLHLIWRRVLKESCGGKYVVDIGASVGPYALYFASRGCRVIAVDPDFRSFGHFTKGIEASRLGARIVPIHASISATVRSNSTLRFNSLDYGESHLITAMGRFSRAASSARWMRTNVPSVDLATILARFPRVDLLKVDVSGSEFSVICSGRTELASGKVRNLLVTADWNTLSTFQGRFLRAQIEGSGFRLAPGHRAIQSWSWDDFFARKSVGYPLYEWTQKEAVKSCSSSCSCFPTPRVGRLSLGGRGRVL